MCFGYAPPVKKRGAKNSYLKEFLQGDEQGKDTTSAFRVDADSSDWCTGMCLRYVFALWPKLK